jgi:hypothetical protein
MARRSITRPPSQTARPATPCPPDRTATGRPCWRANRMAAATSAVSWQHAIIAGRRSTAPFQTRRAAS